MFFTLLLLVINLGISFWNARVTGKNWLESKAAGGWIRIVTWSGAIMSAVGFTYCYAIIITLLGTSLGIIPTAVAKLIMNLTFIGLAIPLLGAGYIITIESWIRAVREKSLLNTSAAVWNTFASAYNTYTTVKTFGNALDSIKNSIDDKGADVDLDSDFGKALILVILVLFGGVVTTAVIMKKYIGTMPIPERQ